MKTSRSLYEVAFIEASKTNPNFGKVVDLLKRAKEEGDARASYALGTWYLHGKHVPKNTRRAMKLIGEAAAANVPEALFDMAVSYEKGNGVRQNLQKAVQFYSSAALRGDVQATYEVGRCFYYGIGVAQDRGLSKVWMARARELGAKR